MSLRTVDVSGTSVVLAMENPVPAGRHPWAIVQGRVLDELIDAPPDADAQIESPRFGLSSRTAPGGLIALAGVPTDLFPALRTQDYTITYSVRAPGYLPIAGEAQLPLDAEFPERFVPLMLGDLSLHRLPMTIVGRVTRRVNGDVVPAAGATVTLTEIWPVLPPPDGSVAPDAPNIVSLRPPLRANRSTATGVIHHRGVTPVLGQDKTLLADVEAEGTMLRVSDRVGLNAGDVVIIDADPAIQEIITVLTLDAVGAPDLPAVLTFTHPLAFRHRRGVRVRRATLQPPGPDRTVARDAIRGDVCVFLDSLASLAGVQVVEVQGGAAPSELHGIRGFSATTDTDGEYSLPPFSRVAQLTAQATDGATTVDLSFAPDYSRVTNRLDIAL